MDRSSAARRSSFWISTLKRKNQCLKKVSNCICHNNSNPGSLGFNHISFFPPKTFKRSQKSKKARCGGSEKFCEEKMKEASQPQEFFHLQTDRTCPTVPDPTNCNRGMFQSPCQQNIFYRGSDLLSYSISHFGGISLLTQIKYKDGSGKI